MQKRDRSVSVGSGRGGSKSRREGRRGKSSRERSQSRGRQRRRRSPSPKCDDQGHLIVRLGSDLTDRYKILDEIGEGTFGKVLECWDRRYEERVAIKVVRNVERYRDGAEQEIEILRAISRRSRERSEWKNVCVKLLDDFEFHGHVCMSFGLYGLSLYDFLKKNRFRGYGIDMVRDIAFQLIACVAWLHDFKLIHTDLKLENILFKSSAFTKDRRSGYRVPSSSDVVLIDFGSATFEYEHHTTIVSTRHYRAPEIVLGTGWSYECDVWSIGCILCELISGDTLFQTHENLEHLAMMEKVLGPIPSQLAAEATRGKKYFNMNKLLWPVNASSDESIREVAKTKSLQEQFPDDPLLLDLLEKTLRYSKFERATVRQCLMHPFFDPIFEENRFQDLVEPAIKKHVEMLKKEKRR